MKQYQLRTVSVAGAGGIRQQLRTVKGHQRQEGRRKQGGVGGGVRARARLHDGGSICGAGGMVYQQLRTVSGQGQEGLVAAGMA